MSSQITVYQTYTSYEKPKEVFKYNKRGNLKLLHIPDLRQHPQFPKFSTYMKNQILATQDDIGDRSLVDFCKANKREHIFLDYNEKREILEDYKQFHGQKTVPIVLANNLETGYTHIVGGYTDLLDYI